MRKNTSGQYGALIEAASQGNDEFKNDVAPITNPIVKAALEEQKAAGLREVKDQILQVLAQSKAQRDQMVGQIRTYRKQVDVWKTHLNKIDRAEAHGTKTGDFRPLLHTIGVHVEGFDAAKWNG